MKKRTYTIKPCIVVLPNGNREQQGYLVTNDYDSWQASHGTICLCQSAVMKREQMRSQTRQKEQIYMKDWYVAYEDCQPTQEITNVRLEIYRMKQNKI